MLRAEFRGLLTGLALTAIAALLLISIHTPIPGIGILQSLRFHIALPMLIIPVLLLTQGAQLRALVVLVAVCLSLGEGAVYIYRQQALRWQLDDRIDPDPVRILSYNLLATNRRGDEIADYIIATLPDIAVIMETPAIESSLERLSEYFPYRVGCEESATCDLSILSRTPLQNVRIETLKFARRRLITVETVVDGRPIAVVAAHLTKPYYDEAAWEEMQKATYTLRRLQGPVVLTGDFNAAAWSDDVREFVDRSGLVPPPRYRATWPIAAGPFGVPIDNMFTKGGALIQSIEAMSDSIGSNHRGLLAEIALPE